MRSRVAAQLCALAILVVALAQAAHASQAETMIDIAAGACIRVKSLAASVNATVAVAAEPALRSSFEAALSLARGAERFVDEARQRLIAGDADGALQCAMQAMERAREAFRALNTICKAARPEEAEAIEAHDRAQGLLVAVNRTLERVARLGIRVEGIETLADTVRSLIERGNVSRAAHELAKANQLVAQAFSELKSRAEEKLVERAAAFVERLCERQGELGKKAEEVGLNATRVFEAAGLGDVGQLKERLKAGVVAPGEVKDLVGQLREASKRLDEVGRAVAAIATAMKPKEEAPRRVKVIDLISNPASWANKEVLVEGRYCGQRPPEGLPGPSGAPPEGSWIVADDSGWIYVVDRGAFKPRVPILEGGCVEVAGSLRVEAGASPYIEARTVLPVAPVVLSPPEVHAPAPPHVGEVLPVAPQPAPPRVLDITIIERGGEGRFYVLKVKLVNAGNDSIVFPSGAYGIVVEKEEGGGWRVFYVPISIQILVELRPGEEKVFTLRLERPPKGDYRVTAVGWLKSSYRPVSAAVEFGIP